MYRISGILLAIVLYIYGHWFVGTSKQFKSSEYGKAFVRKHEIYYIAIGMVVIDILIGLSLFIVGLVYNNSNMILGLIFLIISLVPLISLIRSEGVINEYREYNKRKIIEEEEQ